MNDHNNSTDDDDDNASQGSQRSHLSLLERIRLQREREARQQQGPPPGATTTAMAATVAVAAPRPTFIRVPQYDPHPPAAGGSGGDSPPFAWQSNGASLGTSAFFTGAWSQLSASVESGIAALQSPTPRGGRDDDPDDLAYSLLLPPSSAAARTSGGGDGNDGYSMAGYFLTFVGDVYGGFLRLPVVARLVLVVLLLYVALKLLRAT